MCCSDCIASHLDKHIARCPSRQHRSALQQQRYHVSDINLAADTGRKSSSALDPMDTAAGRAVLFKELGSDGAQTFIKRIGTAAVKVWSARVQQTWDCCTGRHFHHDFTAIDMCSLNLHDIANHE
jgi:hypothetical protein